MKMDIELTDEQFEKVKILEENNISVGEAIDILFEMKDNITLELKRKRLNLKLRLTGLKKTYHYLKNSKEPLLM